MGKLWINTQTPSVDESLSMSALQCNEVAFMPCTTLTCYNLSDNSAMVHTAEREQNLAQSSGFQVLAIIKS